jgi:hypothetical protein
MTDEKPKRHESRYKIEEGDGKLLFGMLAGKMNLATREQIEDCLDTQKEFIAKGVKKRIAQVFIDKGYLSEDEAKKVLAAQKTSLPKKIDTPYEDLVSLYGFASRDTVAQAMEEFKASGRPGAELQDFFVEKGIVTKEQNRVIAVAGRRLAGKSKPKTRLLMVAECPNCFETITKSTKTCPHCKAPVEDSVSEENLAALSEACSPGESRNSCNSCHMTLPDGALDCPYCGAETDRVERRRKPPGSKGSGPVLFLVIIIAAVAVITSVVAGIVACYASGRSEVGVSDPDAILSAWIGRAIKSIENNSAGEIEALVDPRVLATIGGASPDEIRNFLLNTTAPKDAGVTIATERRFKMTAGDRAFVWLQYTVRGATGEESHAVKWRVRLADKERWLVTSVSEPSS